jgi:glutamate synthase (NADPH) large chain
VFFRPVALALGPPRLLSEETAMSQHQPSDQRLNLSAVTDQAVAASRPARQAGSRYRQAERARLQAIIPGALNEPIGHDACGIIATMRKTGAPSHGNVKRAIAALAQMAHRSGEVRGEGDGCGIQIDIPRKLWREWLAQAGLEANLVSDSRFWVGHYFIPVSENPRDVLDQLRARAARYGIKILLERRGQTHGGVLGPMAALTEPNFYQVAGLIEGENGERGAKLFQLALDLEADSPVHVVSQSLDTVVYKVRGSADILDRYYPELRRPDCESTVTIGHNRYSTNTMSTFEQVQPFSLLGHNGEINTIERLRREAEHLGIPLTGGSDSQDLNRLLEGVIQRFGLSLYEALELAFPPVLGEVKAFSPALQDVYMGLRQGLGPLAQGPVALVTRLGNECVFSVDALGLRPLWFGETEKEYFWSSERGVLPLGAFVNDPRPLAPGEKMVALLRPGNIQLFPHHEAQRLLLERAHNRQAVAIGARSHLAGPVRHASSPVEDSSIHSPSSGAPAAFGWEKWDEEYVKTLAERGVEPISSLGYDGPLAALREPKPNLAEFIKETVAVVTNPAIDREREIEQFSTRTVLGRRPLPSGVGGGHTIDLLTPVLPLDLATAAASGSATLADLERQLSTVRIKAERQANNNFPEPLEKALERLRNAVIEAAQGGAELIVLEDLGVYSAGHLPLDPALAIAEANTALNQRDINSSGLASVGQSGISQGSSVGHNNISQNNISLRRRTSLVISSGAIRNLHDIMILLGLGADAVEPWLMFGTFAPAPESAQKLVAGLTKGIEKVMSTMGIHELRGYGRVFGAIGLKPDIAERLGLRSFLASEKAGYGLAELEATMTERRHNWTLGSAGLTRDARFNTRVYKHALAAAKGEIRHEDFTARVRSLELEFPVAARNLLEVKGLEGPSSEGEQRMAEEIDISVGAHSLPFVISGMSFGSQGETAFRAYPEAARRLDMVSMNGEGGEIADMIGKYNRWRGQQVASGRFGVMAEMLNACAFIEIKIGQGAKPGEGGHLPGSKVTVKVAKARHAVAGVDLISPSNNHDLYSIEDLAQLVEELKTINPYAKVCVKVPVVPSIGTIAVGIAKAGADVITLSGFEGGTGAARAHALKYAGMPAELGLRRAHRALVAAGIRDKVELWVDGGMKTALDVIKMVCLGANRVGFGTMAMEAIGCTICRGCQLDTCHVGIATQVETQEEADHKGMKRWIPREHDTAVENLTRFFSGMAAELRAMIATLGYSRLQDMVGKVQHLGHFVAKGALDLSYLLEDVEPLALPTRVGGRVIRKPLNSLTRMVSSWVAEAALSGDERLVYQDGPVQSADRALGTHLSGELARRRHDPKFKLQRAKLFFDSGSIPGNGLGAFNTEALEILVDGGAQDGVGKGSIAGRIVILKGLNDQGTRVDGSVGKSFGYGAIGGLFLVQGNADSRFCIRLSGADVVLGGEVTKPLDDNLGMLAARANAKGFAFEYMTGGRVVVLGDPGPWICSGMTGGVIYTRHNPALGLDEAALERRLAKGAIVKTYALGAKGVQDVRELLGEYHAALVASEQPEAARRVAELLVDPAKHFRMVVPANQQVDASVSTE